MLSYVNTQLRDRYESLDDFCAGEGVNRAELEEKLGAVNYEYSASRNAFI